MSSLLFPQQLLSQMRRLSAVPTISQGDRSGELDQGPLINRALFMVINNKAGTTQVRSLSLKKHLYLHYLQRTSHAFLLSYNICIRYIFTSLFPSHNHLLREAGQLLADKRIETRGAGHPAEGLSSLHALWGQQGPAAERPLGSGLLMMASGGK